MEPDQPTPPAPPTEDAVRHVLAGVLDPELHVDIVELGMVKGIRIEPSGAVTVQIGLTTAACPLRGQITADVRMRVGSMPGVPGVDVEYGELDQAERSALMERARREAARRAPATRIPPTTRVIAVASGKGGVGKSSVTANLAAALATAGHAVGVLDADIWGFSIPRMLGVRGRLAGTPAPGGRGVIVPHVVEVPGTGGSPPGRLEVVSMGLLVDDEQTALMWRGLVLAKALEQFLTDVAWGDLDYLLVDMPPGTGDIQMALARLLPQTVMVVVTTPALAAQRVAARVADMARRSHLAVLGIIENMSEFVAPDGSRHAIFGTGGGRRLAALTGAPLLGTIPIEPAVSDAGDRGEPLALTDPCGPAATEFRRIADHLLKDLLPPVEMSGCTGRILRLAELAGATERG